MISLHALASALTSEGYPSTVAGLGGNVIGLEIVNPSTSARYVLAPDDVWAIGGDDPDTIGIMATHPLATDLPTLIGWVSAYVRQAG